MQCIDRDGLARYFEGKSVAVVGSGPGVLDNEHGFIDSHDVIVRVNNHKTCAAAGFRTDCHYSFYGSSIRKTADELKSEGVKLVLCKCPDEKFMESSWHVKHNKPHGVDFRYIYKARKGWWFCPVYVPSTEEFVASFNLLNKHIPSTGFSALLLVMSLNPKSIYLTGFDFFSSRVHNMNESWRPGNPDDPIGHAPDLERKWLAQHLDRVTLDPALLKIMANESKVTQ